MASEQARAYRLAKECERQGYRVKRTKNGWRVYGKDGETTAGWHQTPSDHRWHRNVVASLRRMGVRI